MILPISLLLALTPPLHTICAAHPDLHTPTLSSTTGYRIALTLHTADDPDKSAHLCESSYTLQITHPDGTSSADTFFSNQDTPDRPIDVHLEGFTHDGAHALAILSERGPTPMLELIVYDLEANTWEIANLLGSFDHVLPPACLPGLRILGTTSTESVVLAPPAQPTCHPGIRWQVDTASSVTGAPLAEPATPLPATTPLLPINSGAFTPSKRYP